MEIARPHLLYTMLGVHVSDALVLKSLVRLLCSRLPEKWDFYQLNYVEGEDWQHIQEKHAQPHFWILGYETWLDLGCPQIQKDHILLVGNVPFNTRYKVIRRPILAATVELQFRAAGKDVQYTQQVAAKVASSAVAARATTAIAQPAFDAPLRFKTMAHYAAPTAAIAVGAAQEKLALTADHTYSLRRWPSTELLRDMKVIRVATALAGNSLSLVQLVQKSNINEAVCRTILEQFHSAGFLKLQADPTSVHNKMPASTSVQSQAAQAARHSQKQVKLSLISMIRQRLGIFS